MSMFDIPDHYDVAATQETGFATGAPSENQDSAENRLEFAKDHPAELVAWMQAGDPEALDNFIEEHKPDYRKWLN